MAQEEARHEQVMRWDGDVPSVAEAGVDVAVRAVPSHLEGGAVEGVARPALADTGQHDEAAAVNRHGRGPVAASEEVRADPAVVAERGIGLPVLAEAEQAEVTAVLPGYDRPSTRCHGHAFQLLGEAIGLLDLDLAAVAERRIQRTVWVEAGDHVGEGDDHLAVGLDHHGQWGAAILPPRQHVHRDPAVSVDRPQAVPSGAERSGIKNEWSTTSSSGSLEATGVARSGWESVLASSNVSGSLWYLRWSGRALRELERPTISGVFPAERCASAPFP